MPSLAASPHPRFEAGRGKSAVARTVTQFSFRTSPWPTSRAARQQSSCEQRPTSFFSWASKPHCVVQSLPSILPIALSEQPRSAPYPPLKASDEHRYHLRTSSQTPRVPRKLPEVDWSVDLVLSSTARQYLPCSSFFPSRGL